MERVRSQNGWFAGRRDFYVTRFLQGFYRTSEGFLEIYRDYLQSGRLYYGDIENLVGSETQKGHLWRLKDDCHQLWRNADPACDLNGCLLDWVIGSIFHEAMKLKENIYLFQYYGPLTHEMEEREQQRTLSFCGLECRRFMTRISREIERQMESLGFMFGRASYLLRIMLPEQSGNFVLLRYLVEHDVEARDLWGESLEEIFSDMFPGAPENGFCYAARSYYEGNWYEKAQDAYQAALRINRQCDEALRRSCQLRVILKTK
ncbi:MAG: hypothetical protein V1706_05360 [Pseudomonadota bacterium]